MKQPHPIVGVAIEKMGDHFIYPRDYDKCGLSHLELLSLIKNGTQTIREEAGKGRHTHALSLSKICDILDAIAKELSAIRAHEEQTDRFLDYLEKTKGKKL